MERPRGCEKRARASRGICMLWVCSRRGIVRSREEERVKRRRSLELGVTRGADYAVCEKSVTKYRRCAFSQRVLLPSVYVGCASVE